MNIFKYPLEFVAEQTIEMPENICVLALQTQRGQPCIWAMVDPKEKLLPRKIIMRGTGNEFRDLKPRYIGTVQEGIFVWHFFDATTYSVGELRP